MYKTGLINTLGSQVNTFSCTLATKLFVRVCYVFIGARALVHQVIWGAKLGALTTAYGFTIGGLALEPKWLGMKTVGIAYGGSYFGFHSVGVHGAFPWTVPRIYAR